MRVSVCAYSSRMSVQCASMLKLVARGGAREGTAAEYTRLSALTQIGSRCVNTRVYLTPH